MYAAVEDVYVSSETPRVNYGDEVRLRTSDADTAFIRLETPADVGALAAATLRMRVRSANGATLRAHAVLGEWSEHSTTAENAPRAGAELARVAVPASTGVWVQLDLSAVITGPGRYDLALKVGPGERASIRSSESSTAPPKLEVTPKAATPPPSTTTSSPGSTSTSTTAATNPNAQPAAPIRAAFFYPWFPNAWDQGGRVPFTQYTPSLGQYRSSDPALIDRQVQLATGAGLEAFIASWWGRGHHTDSAAQAVLARIPSSPNPAFRLAVYYEEEGQSDPSPDTIVSDLRYLERLFSQPGYLRVGGKPVVFVWADAADGSGMAARWAQARAAYGGNVHVVLKVYSGYGNDTAKADSWHQYGPASAYSQHLPWSATVSPGFWHANEQRPRLERSPSRFAADAARAAGSGAFWQLVTTWNEWGEGTSVEPAAEFGSAYLDALSAAFGAAPPPPPPPPTTTTTSTSTSTTRPPATTTTTAAGEAKVTFAAGGDFGMTASTDATLASIANSDAELLLALGDLSYSNASAPEWCRYVSGRLGAGFPVELVVGNHEDDDRVDGYIGDFTACLPDRMRSTGVYGAQYYFDVGGLARFVMLGAGNDVAGVSYDYRRGSAPYQWLVQAIDSARAAGLRWVIVGMHKVCLTAGEKPCEVGADLYDLLLAKKVDLILHGHDHNYQRSKQLSCATPGVFRPECVADDGADGRYGRGAGSVFAIVGTTGGGGTYAINPADPDHGYLAAANGAVRGYLLATITASELSFQFVGMGTSYSDRVVIR